MPKAVQTVEQFLRELEHPRKAEIEAVRALVLATHPGVTEHVKWNAPSFCLDGEDRVTMKLQPRNCLQLVFHRGVKVKAGDGFTFEDPSGLLKWVAADRALVTLQDAAELEARGPALARVVRRWMQATRA